MVPAIAIYNNWTTSQSCSWKKKHLFSHSAYPKTIHSAIQLVECTIGVLLELRLWWWKPLCLPLSKQGKVVMTFSCQTHAVNPTFLQLVWSSCCFHSCSFFTEWNAHYRAHRWTGACLHCSSQKKTTSFTFPCRSGSGPMLCTISESLWIWS